MEFQSRPFEEMVDFLTSAPKPEQIVAYKQSAQTQANLDLLLEKNAANDLTELEKKELEQFLFIEHLMRLAKGKARRKIVA